VLHDVTLPGWLDSLDHLVVGPSGVWVVGSGQGRGRLPGGAGAPAGILRGLRWQSEAIAEVLNCWASVPVRSLLCVHGRWSGGPGRSRAARSWPHGNSPRSSTPGPRWPLTKSSGPLPGCWRCCDRQPEHEGPEERTMPPPAAGPSALRHQTRAGARAGQDADSVELKLPVPDSDRRATLTALGIGPAERQDPSRCTSSTLPTSPSNQHPPVDGDVVDLDPALGEQLLDVTVGQTETQVPTDR
jgi:hypothetical protein